MEKKTMGNFLATLRKGKGMTQRELAEKLNVSDKSISRWERDESVPELSLIPIIAEIFDVTSDELIKGTRFTETAKDKKVKHMTEQNKNNFKYIEMKLVIRSIIVIAVAMLGLIVSMICNFGFQRATIGFFLGTALYVIASACEFIVVIIGKQSIDCTNLDEATIRICKKKILDISKKVFFVISLLFLASLPLIMCSWHSYMGISATTWFLYGVIFCIAGTIIYLLICFLRNMNARKYILKLLLGLIITFVLQMMFNQCFEAKSFSKSNKFDTFDEFKEFMETPSGEKNENETVETEYIYDDDDNVLYEYHDMRGDVAMILYSDTIDGFPVTVYKDGDLQKGDNIVQTINIVFIIMYVLEFIIFGVTCLKIKKKKIDNNKKNHCDF